MRHAAQCIGRPAHSFIHMVADLDPHCFGNWISLVLGRVLRGKTDYGIMILADKRFSRYLCNSRSKENQRVVTCKVVFVLHVFKAWLAGSIVFAA
jgi:hypothetical protein